MSIIQCRGSIARAVVMVVVVGVVALFSTRAAVAQVGVNPVQPQEPGGLVNRLLTGVEYDLVNQRAAEWHLPRLQAKLGRDIERGHSVAAGYHAYRIDDLRYRIVVDEWLIKQNSLCNPGAYPYPFRLDPMTCTALANVRRPPYSPPLPPSGHW